jgi:hypothetical protein
LRSVTLRPPHEHSATPCRLHRGGGDWVGVGVEWMYIVNCEKSHAVESPAVVIVESITKSWSSRRRSVDSTVDVEGDRSTLSSSRLNLYCHHPRVDSPFIFYQRRRRAKSFQKGESMSLNCESTRLLYFISDVDSLKVFKKASRWSILKCGLQSKFCGK